MKAVSLISLLLLLLSSDSFALPKTATAFQSWIVNCEPSQNTKSSQCFLVQTVSNKANNQPILRAMAGFPSNSKKPSAIFLFANLLDLNTKIKLVFSTDFAISFKLSKCNKQSKTCLAIISLDEKLLEAFYSGEVAYILYDFADKERKVPFSLLGFEAGIKALSE